MSKRNDVVDKLHYDAPSNGLPHHPVADFITDIADAANRLHEHFHGDSDESRAQREATSLGELVRQTANRLSPRELSLFRSELFALFDTIVTPYRR
uniref:DUF2267 domain-containing protein n=1 Tax=Steinernema glaseri TaxID=37863 RepID=A0A1I8ALU5_9BILA